MSISFKKGVDVVGIQPEAVLAIIICDQVYTELGQSFCVTSVFDGSHKKDSLHYLGLAVDIRIRDLKGISPSDVAACIRSRLPAAYDVFLEPDHIHVEFDHVKTF